MLRCCLLWAARHVHQLNFQTIAGQPWQRNTVMLAAYGNW
jgi:hypothetical protein